MPDYLRDSYWLPESYTVGLTALDLGWLSAKFSQMEDGLEGEVCEPGPDGQVVQTTFKRRFLKKLQALIDPMYEGEDDGNDSRRSRDTAPEMP